MSEETAAGPTANGHSNGRERVANTGDPNRRTRTLRDEVRGMVENWGAIRSQFFRNFFTGPDDSDFNRNCKYPDTSELRNPWWFRELYEREPIAARVVQLMPKECWKVQPLVYESDSPDEETEFERAWDQLSRDLQGMGWYSDEKGSLVWEYCKRADILSRIGRFGVMLLGIDDGRNLDQPADGVMTVNPTTNRVWPSRPRATADPSCPETEVNNIRECDGSPEHGIPAQPHAGEEFGGRKSAPMVPVVNSAGRVKFIAQRKAELLVNARRMTVNQVVDEEGEVVYNRRERRGDDGGLEFVANVWAEPPNLDDDITDNAMTPMGVQGGGPSKFGGWGPNQDRHEPDWSSAKTRAGEPLWPTSFAGAQGTDAQYVGVQLSAPEFPSDEPSEGRKLFFIRCFDEALVQVVQYEADVRNPRFGMPVMYRITLNDPSTQSSGIGLPLATVRVHWSRVVHLPGANRQSSEVFSIPEMQQVLNPILDVRKIRGAGAEGYWRSCFTRFALETHPQLGGDVSIDEEGTREKLRSLVDDLEPGLVLMGMSARTLAPSVVDPTPHIAINIEAICIKLGCPIRIFKGAERGEMASSQDDENWNNRCREMNISYTNPVIVVGLIDRLISLGVLPAPKGRNERKQAALEHKTELDEIIKSQPPAAPPGGPPGGGAPPFGGPPTGNSSRWRRVSRGKKSVFRLVRNADGEVEVKDEDDPVEPEDEVIGRKVVSEKESDVFDSPEGYSVEWPDLSALGPQDKAGIALSVTQAIAAYVQGNIEALIPPRDYLAEIIGPVLGWDEEKVEQILGDVKEAQVDAMTMPSIGEDGHPATAPEPIPPAPLMVPHGSTLDDDVQTPGGVVEGPEPPEGEHAQHPGFQIPGKGDPGFGGGAPPFGGGGGGAPFGGKGGGKDKPPGAVAKKNAKDRGKLPGKPHPFVKNEERWDEPIQLVQNDEGWVTLDGGQHVYISGDGSISTSGPTESDSPTEESSPKPAAAEEKPKAEKPSKEGADPFKNAESIAKHLEKLEGQEAGYAHGGATMTASYKVQKRLEGAKFKGTITGDTIAMIVEDHKLMGEKVGPGGRLVITIKEPRALREILKAAKTGKHDGLPVTSPMHLMRVARQLTHNQLWEDKEPVQNLDEETAFDYLMDKPEEDDRLQHPDAPLSSETGVPRSSPTPSLSEAQSQHTLGDSRHPEELGHGSQSSFGAMNEEEPVQNLSERFHLPENHDKIRDLPNGLQLHAGANDWENGWSWAWIIDDSGLKGDSRYGGPYEPLDWLRITHAACPGCGGNNSQDEDGPTTKEEKAACIAYAKEAVDKWVSRVSDDLSQNAFCPTGEGGGIDATCSPGERGAHGVHEGGDDAYAKGLTPAPCCPSVLTPDAHNARVGVSAFSVPPPPANGIPRLPNLTPDQREVETRFAEKFLKNPDKMVGKYREALAAGKVGVAPNVFATDDVKMLNRDWNPDRVRAGEELTKGSKEAMAKYNTAVHQTANAIAKRAFVEKLDEMAKLKDGDPLKSVLVTNGGCAAGKGSTLSHAEEPDSPYNKVSPAAAQVGAVWDAAGEQNATENDWIHKECSDRGITPTYSYVWANPEDGWDSSDRGVIRRAVNKGRMVDAALFADSYAEGAKNMAAFADKHKGDGTKFIFIDNRTKGEPKLLKEFPKETLKWDSKAIRREAVANLKGHAKSGKLPKVLTRAGLAGETIWGPSA